MKSFENTRSDENLKKIDSELFEIQGILDRNMEMLMNRGRGLEDIGKEARVLREGSERMRRKAERTKWEMLLRKYALFAVLGGLFLVFVVFRYFF